MLTVSVTRGGGGGGGEGKPIRALFFQLTWYNIIFVIRKTTLLLL